MTRNTVPYYTANALNCTYKEVIAMLLWSISAVNMKYLHSYSVGVPVWVLKSGATWKKHYYFCVVTSAV